MSSFPRANSARSTKFRRSAIALAVVPVTIFSSSAVAFAAESDQVNLNVMGVTDFHGHIEHTTTKTGETTEMGAAALACYLDNERAANPNTSFVSAGDNIGGSPFVSSILKDQPTIDSLNAMDLEASAVGNHEFDKGWNDLQNRVGVDGSKAAKFPYLAANVKGSTMAPSKVVEKGGVKIGYVGVITDTTPTLVSPDGIKGLSFSAPVAAAKAEADRLKSAGEADVVVVLAHEGVNADGFGSNVDAVIAGHTHQDRPASATSPVVIQPDSYGKLLADIDITYDKAAKKVVSVSAKNISAQAVWDACGETPNAEVQTIVSAAQEGAKEEGSKVVTNLRNDFYRGSNAGKDTGSNRGTESSLNSMLADAALYGINEKTSLKADIGIMNAGGVRADLASGDVTFSEAYAVQPFGNNMAVAEISGAELKGVMEQQWRVAATKDERPTLILGFSDNVQYSYNPDAEMGSKISHVTINGKPLDENARYRVAGATFLLNEGDGYTDFHTQDGKNTVQDSGMVDVDLFNRYLEDHSDVEVRKNQTSVGVTLTGGNADGTASAGQKLGIDLSSLSYTASEQKPSSVTVEIKGTAKTETATADVNNNITDNQNETGRAHVDLTVPEGATSISIKDNLGTTFEYPLNTGTDAGNGTPGSSNLPGSSDNTPLGSIDLSKVNPRTAGLITFLIGLLGASAGIGGALYWWFTNRR